MTPLMRRLHTIFPELPELGPTFHPSEFKKRIELLDTNFYRKIIPLHVELNAEYSLLGQQLRAKFPAGYIVEHDEENRVLLFSAIKMAELLKHIHQHYLIVPREVARLRTHQEHYVKLLNKLGYSYELTSEPKVPERFLITSLSQKIRQTTIRTNFYRILFLRSKRALELFASLNSHWGLLLNVLKEFNKLANPFVAYLGFLFFLPRLFVNLFLVFKHTISGFWMEDTEKSLSWVVRFKAQIQRRWFELGNDLVWAAVGALNRFLLIGSLAPVGAVLTLAAFAFDVVLSAARTYVELGRLYRLRSQYKTMHNESDNENHLKALDQQIRFERFRLGTHLASTLIIFIGMTCIWSLVAVNPIMALIASVILVALSLFNIAVAQRNNKNRPKDTLEDPSPPKEAKSMSFLRFFAKKKPVVKEELPQDIQGVNFDSAIQSLS